MIAIVDTSGVVEFVTPSIERLLALAPPRIEGTSLFNYVVFDEQPVLHELLDQLTAGHEVVGPRPSSCCCGRTGRSGGSRCGHRTSWTTPTCGGIVLNGRDVTERRTLPDTLTYEATHDRLTELPNRAQFLHILGRAEERAIGEGRSLAVLFVDLDRFEVVNDSLGHNIGDALLVAVARPLVGAVRPTVARLGGDEFVVVCEGVDLAGAKMVAGSCWPHRRRPFAIAGRESRHGEHRHRVR